MASAATEAPSLVKAPWVIQCAAASMRSDFVEEPLSVEEKEAGPTLPHKAIDGVDKLATVSITTTPSGDLDLGRANRDKTPLPSGAKPYMVSIGGLDSDGHIGLWIANGGRLEVSGDNVDVVFSDATLSLDLGRATFSSPSAGNGDKPPTIKAKEVAGALEVSGQSFDMKCAVEAVEIGGKS